jgi:hypothetical protein
MKRHPDLWRDVALPVAVSIGVFCTLNLLWALLGLHWIPTAIGVYMLGSLVALAFLTRAIRQGTLTLEEAGLGSRGWRPQCRFFGLVLAVSLVAWLYLNPTEAIVPLQFGSYCFWFYFLMQASLAELLIFVCLAYCLPERWLKSRGRPTWQAVLLAGLFSSVTFGWHHYTGEPDSHQWAWVTIPVMWINLLYFIPARNFHLTMLMHNAIAAVGFTEQQYAHVPPKEWQNPATYATPVYITAFIVSFALPYVLLHALEWWASRQASPTPGDSRVATAPPQLTAVP